MMRAFLKFNAGLMRMPVPVRLWLMLLITANMIIPLFFLGRLEAQVVLAALLASMMLMTALTAISGFTRLLGVGHVFWVPLLWFLWTRLDQTPSDSFFGVWLRILMTLNALSLVIDTADVIRYVRGDRGETVKGLA
jgi:hypothetical protein